MLQPSLRRRVIFSTKMLTRPSRSRSPATTARSRRPGHASSCKECWATRTRACARRASRDASDSTSSVSLSWAQSPGIGSETFCSRFWMTLLCGSRSRRRRRLTPPPRTFSECSSSPKTPRRAPKSPNSHRPTSSTATTARRSAPRKRPIFCVTSKSLAPRRAPSSYPSSPRRTTRLRSASTFATATCSPRLPLYASSSA
mmetsp:Transcript_28405/g.95643  ORF Transcript_28405/g.95643 Transcript_28405/m.95643 type:complete len:200 (-) Transcript_28405:3210-3809(-)